MNNDPDRTPVDPQFPLGPTTSDAKMAAQLQVNPLGGPGTIVQRMSGMQFELPRAQPDAQMSDRPGINTGES